MNSVKIRVTNNRFLLFFILCSSLVAVTGISMIFAFTDLREINIIATRIFAWLILVLIPVFLIARKVMRPECIITFNGDTMCQKFLRSRKKHKYHQRDIAFYEEKSTVVRNINSTYFIVRFRTNKEPLVITKDPLSEEAAGEYVRFKKMFSEWISNKKYI